MCYLLVFGKSVGFGMETLIRVVHFSFLLRFVVSGSLGPRPVQIPRDLVHERLCVVAFFIFATGVCISSPLVVSRNESSSLTVMRNHIREV